MPFSQVTEEHHDDMTPEEYEVSLVSPLVGYAMTDHSQAYSELLFARM